LSLVIRAPAEVMTS